MVRAMQYRMFWRGLAEMVGAGMGLLQSINIAIRQLPENDQFCVKLKKISEDIQGGRTFSEAMETSGLFSEAETKAIHGGEYCGRLESVLPCLANDQVLTRARQYEILYSTLSVLLDAGVPILDALSVSANGLDEPLKLAVLNIRNSIKSEKKISEAKVLGAIFSELEFRMIDECEYAGNLDSALERLAKLSRPFEFS